jgi:hypothetical protein
VQAVGEDPRPLGADPVVDSRAFRRHHDAGRAEVAGVLHAADETALIQGLDDAGQHGRVQALELGQLGQAQGAAGMNQAEDGVLRGGEVLARGRLIEHAGEPGDDRAQPGHEFGVHHVLRNPI